MAEPPSPTPSLLVDGHQLPTASCKIYELVMDRLTSTNAEPFHILIHGAAGIGKSLLLKAIRNGAEKKFGYDNSVISTAPTAMAAALIDSNTIHSTFILKWVPIRIEDFLEDANETQMQTLSSMENAKLLLIDNINYVSNVDFARIDHRLQQITGNRIAFGGLAVIIFGDFYQLPPSNNGFIFEDLHDEHLEKHRLKTPASPDNLWSKFKIVDLNLQNFRNRNLQQTELEAMRKDSDKPLLWEFLNRNCFICKDQFFRAENIIQKFEQLCDNRPDKKFAILTYTIEIANFLNNEIVRRERDSKKYESVPSTSGNYPKTWEAEDLSVIIATGSPVVLIHNDIRHNIKNGTAGIVHELNDDLIKVSFPTGIIRVTRIDYKKNNQYFRQFPLRLAYAHTVDKAQGATFDGVILVRNHTWSFREVREWGENNSQDDHGQLYTALSRARDLTDCKVKPIRWLAWEVNEVVVKELEKMNRDCKA